MEAERPGTVIGVITVLAEAEVTKAEPGVAESEEDET